MKDCSTAPTPGRALTKLESKEDSPELTEEDKGLYRKVVGILLYMQTDRPDIQHAVHCLSRTLNKPHRETVAIASKVCSLSPRDARCRNLAAGGSAGQHAKSLYRLELGRRPADQISDERSSH